MPFSSEDCKHQWDLVRYVWKEYIGYNGVPWAALVRIEKCSLCGEERECSESGI